MYQPVTQAPSTKLDATLPQTPLRTRIDKYREGAFNYQMRRHDQWRENYTLYRDKVITNRLTQRQSVNVPLMKSTIKTILSKTDEFTDLYFENRANDKQEEIFLNEYWKWNAEKEHLEEKDIVDKKQVGLYGRSFIKLNLSTDLGRITFEVLEPYDVLVDRYADPANIDDTANYVSHIHIYRTLSALSNNPLYDKEAINRLALYYSTSAGLEKSNDNYLEYQSKVARMQDMGVFDTASPELGETYVELEEHYLRLWDDTKKESYIQVIVTCNAETLASEKLENLLGVNFFPLSTWADDVERADFWSDGVSDIVRTPNKVLNSFFSQLVENRTLRNYGMTFYDFTAPGNGEKWAPQTYDPAPWAWIPTYGDPNKTTKRIDVPDLSEAMGEMGYIKTIVEEATASTATEKGVQESGQITLGQIQIMMANANERITSMAKFYRPARADLGRKWYALVIANKQYLSKVELYKKSFKGNYFSEEFDPSTLKEGKGYKVVVTSTAERDKNNLETVQKMKAVQADFQGNLPLQRILQQKELDLLDLNPDESAEVMDFEKQKAAAAANPAPGGGPVPGMGPGGLPHGLPVGSKPEAFIPAPGAITPPKLPAPAGH